MSHSTLEEERLEYLLDERVILESISDWDNRPWMDLVDTRICDWFPTGEVELIIHDEDDQNNFKRLVNDRDWVTGGFADSIMCYISQVILYMPKPIDNIEVSLKVEDGV